MHAVWDMVLLGTMVLIRPFIHNFLSLSFLEFRSPFVLCCLGVMDRSRLLFGLSSSTVELMSILLDLDIEGGGIQLPPRDLDFYEVFCGAAHLSSQMREVSSLQKA